MARQLIRSSTSVAANLAEGQSGSSKKDFINFNNIALKSANESKLWIRMIVDALEPGESLREALKVSVNELEEIANIIASIILSAKKLK